MICNPFPGDSLPLEVYGNLVETCARTARRCSSTCPRRASTARSRAGPDLVKVNDWELAEYVHGPVDEPERLRAAAERLRDAGAGIVLVTRGGEPALVLSGDEALRARAAALRARLARGLRRLDDGRARGRAGRPGATGERGAHRLGAGRGRGELPAPRPGHREPRGRRGARRSRSSCGAAREHGAATSSPRTIAARRLLRDPVDVRPRAARRRAAARSRADSRTGRPPCDECASLASTWHEPARRRGPACPRPPRRRACVGGAPGSSAPRSLSAVQRSTSSPPGWRSGWATTQRKPRRRELVDRAQQRLAERARRAARAGSSGRRRRASARRSSSTSSWSTIVCGDLAAGGHAHRQPLPRQLVVQRVPPARAARAMRTSWSWRMCGVAQTDLDAVLRPPGAPSRRCRRGRAAPSSMPGRMWQWRSITRRRRACRARRRRGASSPAPGAPRTTPPCPSQARPRRAPYRGRR